MNKKNTGVSSKHAKINKAATIVTAAVGISTFIVIFSLFGSYSLLGQRSFQSRVIKEKEVAKRQLEDNKIAVDELKKSYQEFISEDPNAIGGSRDGDTKQKTNDEEDTENQDNNEQATEENTDTEDQAEAAEENNDENTGSGNKERDGDNAKLVLDALPSKYDYPALISSLEKVLTDNQFPIIEITGTDDEIAQGVAAEVVDPVEMPFELKTEGNFDSVFTLLEKFDKSIRPIHPNEVTITATDEGIELFVLGLSYYLPETGLKITEKEVR